MVGRPETCDDPRFDSIATRSKNIVALYELAGACFLDKTTDEWLVLLRELEIPAARMASLDELMTDPQLKASGFFKRATHPSEGEIVFTDMPVRFSEETATNARLQPRLGEHSIEILREAGLADDEIDALIASGAAGSAQPPARAAE
jgi:crotonobetainyl-CoA:carnitine CoA-transferase CaiB-like acyl-CoA transferase